MPALVAGKRVVKTGEEYRISYEGGHDVVLPKVGLSELRSALETTRELLKHLSIEEIVAFFDEVAKAWFNPTNEWRQTAMEWGPRITGYAPDIIENDINFVGAVMTRAPLFDMIETDLGDPDVLDDWTRYKATYYRAWPKGLVAHVMVGNVPLSGFFTMVRSLVTKNITVAKTSRRDTVIPQCLAQCIHDVDPNHPVTRALSALYWEAESEIEDAVLEAADVVTVWGRANSIQSIKSRLRYGTDLIEFGPKRSFGLFLEGIEDWDKAGLWLAFDVINYNQEACFSAQEAFVVGDPKPLAENAATWLSHFSRSVPVMNTTMDMQAHIQRMRMEAVTDDWQVLAPAGTDWTVVITDGPVELAEHPLGRTVFIHPVDSVADVIATVDDNVQSVTVEPFARVAEVADALTGAGADRVLASGHTARMRPGFVHDGMHPMRRMVRWSAIERGSDFPYRAPIRSVEEEDRNYGEWAKGDRTYAERREYSPYRSYGPDEIPAPRRSFSAQLFGRQY